LPTLVIALVFLVFGVAMGVVLIWDIGGVATRMRAEAEEQPFTGSLMKRMPSWTFRAFGIWCVAFGVGFCIWALTLQ
jgi:hypothetical protein